MIDAREIATNMVMETVNSSMGVYFETDKDDIEQSIDNLTEEINELDKYSCLRRFLEETYGEEE